MIKVIKSQYFWLGLILLLGLIVRLYKIDSPIADWHSWRQADTAAVTRNFIKYGFNPLIPKYDDMSGVAENPIANPNTFRFVEFPIYNIVTYPFYLLFGIDEIYHRLVSILFSLGSTIFVFLISKRYINTFTALLAALIFALLPFNVFFSRTTLPESTFVFFALGMVYFLERWISSGKSISGVWGFIFTAIAFLVKPWAIFFSLPLIYLAFKKGKRFFFKFLFFIILALIPFIFWRLWILQLPQGIPASNWLFNGDGIRLRPAFFWWIISERIGREILGVTGMVLFTIGLLVKPKDGRYFLHFWFLSIVLYFVVVATGNVRHNYYQFLFVPVASIFVAKGFSHLIIGSENFTSEGRILFIPRIWTILLALLFLPLTFYFGWKQVKEFYKINNSAMVEAGRRSDQILPKDAVVLAPYNGDVAFLYQTNRPGWPVAAFPIKELIADYGVTHYISTSYDDKTNWVLRHFNPVLKTPQYVIADLTKLKKTFDKKDPEP